MRLTVFTNIPSHHQIPMGRAFAEKLGRDFNLVAWDASLPERSQLGWRRDFDDEWLIIASQSERQRIQALDLLQTSDVIIWGYAPLKSIKLRVANNKLTFRNMERPFKRGRWGFLDPRVIWAMQKYGQADKPSHHMLAIGAYCADDFRLIGKFKDKMWRWGYFPEFPTLETSRVPNSIPTILWAGRMLDWKQVNLLIEAAKWLNDRTEVPFHMQFIGYGPEENALRSLVVRFNLTDRCTFLGPRTPEQVTQAMQAADIYVFPSNRYEGWGVVVNEAMSCECCVIGSTQTGSVPWLIQDGVNGFWFDGESVEALGEKLLMCVNSAEHRLQMGRAARVTIETLWSPSVASERFLHLADTVLCNKQPDFTDQGPCSPA